ncbi:MAG TPA: glycosyltransferase family 39 protein [Vicinamibacteria bacterium]|nr:glycosyltransferase family 39 protein [Vicinamibacteria bacterium]
MRVVEFRTKTPFALGLIGALALGLRLWGMDYGLPHPTSRPDEERIVGRAQTIFATGEWHPGSFYYPSLLYYVNTVALYGYYGAKKLVGDYERPFDFLFDIAVTRPGLHYRVSRLVSVLAGVGTALATYALGLAAYRRRSAALLAGLAVAVCHVHVRDSHFATVDIPVTLFVTLSLVFAARLLETASSRHAALAGLCAGLAASTKYNGGLVAAAIAVALWRVRAPMSRWICAGLAAMLAFALTSPYVVLRFAAFRNDMSFLQDFLYGSSESPIALWTHLRTTLPAGLGFGLFLASGVGAAVAVKRRNDADVVLLSFLVPFFLIISSVRITFPRYVLPLVPVLTILASDVVASLIARVPRRGRALAWTVAVVALIAPSLSSSLAFDRIAARWDTRVEAARFIAATTPPQTRILLCGGYGAPPVNEDRRRPPAYRVEVIDCLSEPPLAAFNQARLLVTHEHRELSAFSRVAPELLEWLEAHAENVASFDPYRRESQAMPFFFGSDAFYIPYAGFEAVVRGGPLVRVWELPGS